MTTKKSKPKKDPHELKRNDPNSIHGLRGRLGAMSDNSGPYGGLPVSSMSSMDRSRPYDPFNAQGVDAMGGARPEDNPFSLGIIGAPPKGNGFMSSKSKDPFGNSARAEQQNEYDLYDSYEEEEGENVEYVPNAYVQDSVDGYGYGQQREL